MRLIKDKSFLRQKATVIPSKEEYKKIEDTIFGEMEKNNLSGLSSNQLGMKYRVCAINIKDKIFMVNPQIIWNSGDKVIYPEYNPCIPGKLLKVVRNKEIKVKCDNFETELHFSADNKNPDDKKEDKGMHECACVQHLINLLDGVVPNSIDFNNMKKTEKERKFGRNDKVLIENKTSKERISVKYKNIPNLTEWAIL